MSHSGKLTNSTGWNAIFSWIKYALTGKRDNAQAVQDTEVSAESLVNLNARVEALESALTSLGVEADKVDYKIVQKAVANPSVPSSGTTTATSFISAVTQNENGEIAPERRNLPTASASVSGIVQLNDATNSTSTSQAATANAVKKAYDLASSKADPASVVDSAVYDSSNHTIIFKHGSTQLFTLDAAAFVKDGMVDSVAISNGNLVITFNTDAGKQPISIPLTDIFNPNNYYTKTDTDALLAAKQPERLVVTPTESGGVYSNDFATISAAVTAGKDVWLRISGAYDNSSYFHYVPLSEAVFKNGAYTKFIFARPRSYETDAEGIIDTWTCTSSSPYWVYASKNVYYAATAGVAASAGTANSASNANLSKTTDATNGDVLYIGGGTQQRIENAGHATSAKDYDQTGGIATALNSKQNLLYFTNTDGGTTSNPAADKEYVDAVSGSWMLAVGTNYVKYYNAGVAFDSGTIGNIIWLSQIIYLAETTTRIDIRGNFGSLVTFDNRFAIFPPYAYCGLNGSAEIRRKCKQYVRYLVTLTNTGDSAGTVYACCGGRATTTKTGYIRRGTLWVDGVVSETYTGTDGNPWDWTVPYYNNMAIGSVPARASRTWEVWWYEVADTPGSEFSGRDYMFVTTIK